MALDTYFRVSHELFNIDNKSELFFLAASGSGMKKVGINDKDMLLFKSTKSPIVGSIVAAEINGELKCCKCIKKVSKLFLRRLNIKEDLSVENCNIKGQLVSLVRNFS